jgi:MraZ protein
MYVGKFNYSSDAKNRVVLPAKLRGNEKSFIITRGPERCLYLFPQGSWRRVLKKMESVSPHHEKEDREAKRTLLAGSFEVGCDAQGRIIVPRSLKEHAHIRSGVTIVGAGDRVEIWSKENWSKYLRDFQQKSVRSLVGRL